ncbi:MAG TPA: type II secretion system F family protein [Pirellulaceae bacterium]|nr:type II secretion system F family protein [Pirellulaceae bacterium]
MISTRSLIQLCRRVGTAVKSGIDARRVWEMEERHATGPLKAALGGIRQQIAHGGTVAEGMQGADGYFPPMFVQMVAIGEQTGKLDEVLHRLAEHYEHLATMQRTFWIGIAWPLFELVFAVLVIGLLILVTGIIGAVSGGDAPDVLGWGLVGPSGALVWFTFCAFIAGGITLFCMAITRGWMGPQPMLLAMRIPVLGKCLESLALSRLTWSLALALDSGMDARRAVELSIRAAQNPYYESSLPRVTAGIRANRQFHESFADGEVFPTEFLQQLETAELAGATTETLLRLATEYEDRARTSLRILTGIATVLVMLLVFGVMIFAIFSLFYHAYLKPMHEALEMAETGRI